MDGFEAEAEPGPVFETQATWGEDNTIDLRLRGPDASAYLTKVAAAPAGAELQRRQRQDEALPTQQVGNIVGNSPALLKLLKLLGRIEKSDATVLVLGENGSGKELVARAIHNRSKRSTKSFVACNCSAFNDNLLESELFGHRKGAFTGAISDKQGLFQMADQGTFFMDEVGDMSPALQVKLLRVIQEGTFMRVGGTQARRVDVRIVAATNRDLKAKVRDGSFREDLYYRLNVVSVQVPALRERREDIPLLANFFLEKLNQREATSKSLSREAHAWLQGYRWPGNVRELENEVERAWVLSGEAELIDEAFLSPHITPGDSLASGGKLYSSPAHFRGASEALGAERPLGVLVAQIEQNIIEEALERCEGNRSDTAKVLGISRRNLIRKLQQYRQQD